MKDEKINKSLSRVPQSLSFDNSALLRTFDHESTIIRDLIVYAGNEKMKNLFNEVSFTIDDFCSEFNYSKTTLQRTMKEFVDNPKLIPIIDGHKFDSLFEHSLYRALKENIIFSRKKDGKETFQTVQIIEKLEVDYKKDTNKRTKRKYTIKLGTKILDFLFTEYNLIDYNEYRGIQTNKISSTGAMRNFYIYMGKMVANVQFELKKGNGNSYVLSIDDLCSVFGADIKEPRNKKEYISKTLTCLQSDVKSLSFNWKFITKNTRHSYFVEFDFPQSTIEYFNEHRKARFYKRLYEEMSRIYKKTKMPKTEDYKSIPEMLKEMGNLPQEDFLNWFTSGTEDIENKTRIFQRVYGEIYGA